MNMDAHLTTLANAIEEQVSVCEGGMPGGNRSHLVVDSCCCALDVCACIWETSVEARDL